MIGVGDKVKVVSSYCLSEGASGVVVEVNGQMVKVEYDTFTLPGWYSGNSVAWLKETSLKRIGQKVTSDETKGPKSIALICGYATDINLMLEHGYAHIEDPFVVMAHSKEHALKLLNQSIEEDQLDPEEFRYMVFGGKLYHLDPVYRVEIVEEG